MATWESFSAFGASAFPKTAGGRRAGQARGRWPSAVGNGLSALA